MSEIIGVLLAVASAAIWVCFILGAIYLWKMVFDKMHQKDLVALEKLRDLLDRQIITEVEYQKIKEKIIKKIS